MSTLVLGMQLKDRLRAAREAKKISQRELARRAGLKSWRHVGLIEDGQRDNITATTAEGLARELGCSLDWLLLGNGAAPEGVKLDA